MSGEYRKANRRICHMLMLLNKAPRTREELSQITSIGQQSVGRWLLDMEEEGLVSATFAPRPDGQPGGPKKVWKWEGA